MFLQQPDGRRDKEVYLRRTRTGCLLPLVWRTPASRVNTLPLAATPGPPAPSRRSGTENLAAAGLPDVESLTKELAQDSGMGGRVPQEARADLAMLEVCI